jgi:hypothetical protein
VQIVCPLAPRNDLSNIVKTRDVTAERDRLRPLARLRLHRRPIAEL